jgi:hypothetical protein
MAFRTPPVARQRFAKWRCRPASKPGNSPDHYLVGTLQRQLRCSQVNQQNRIDMYETIPERTFSTAAHRRHRPESAYQHRNGCKSGKTRAHIKLPRPHIKKSMILFNNLLLYTNIEL